MSLTLQQWPRQVLYLFVIVTVFVGDAFTAETPPPNIVFVYTDDQAAWALGTAVEKGWFNDVPAAQTPNMDRLAREGAIFNNFFCTTPVCSPARAAIMTGRYASEFGITDFIPQPGHRLYDPEHDIALDPDDSLTFPELLQQHNYKTGLVGKWHLGDWTAEGREEFHPTNHGFEYFMGLTGGGIQTVDPLLEENGEVRQFEGLTCDILTDRALKFIEQSKGKPFLLCLHTRAPHGKWLPVAPEDWQPYESLDPTIPNPEYSNLQVAKVNRQMREYLASTSCVDRNLGRVLDLLDEMQLADNTVVLFSSDHGYCMGHNGIWHKGNGIWAVNPPPSESHHGTRVISDKYRPNLYDHSLRTPFIVRWPKVVQPGTVINDTATSLDVFPTLAAVAQIELPADVPLRGRNLCPLLKGQSIPDWDQYLYAEYHMINYVEADMKCYRTPHYKLIRDDHNSDRDEFYDLLNDPSESHNLIDDSRPEIQSAIMQLDDQLQERALLLKAH